MPHHGEAEEEVDQPSEGDEDERGGRGLRPQGRDEKRDVDAEHEQGEAGEPVCKSGSE